MAYIYDLTDTWSAGGTAFNAIKMNVTDSASAAGSKLITLQTNGAEHFSVSKAGVGYFSGNVGIGTGSPLAKLDVRGNMWVRQSDGSYFNFNSTSTVADIEYSNTGAVRFIFNGVTETMRITADGNVGIGTTSPGAKLDVRGLVAVGSGSSSYISANYNSEILAGVDGGGYYYASGFGAASNIPITMGDRASYIAFKTSPSTSAGFERMRITGTGDVGIGTGSPANKLDIVSNSNQQLSIRTPDAAAGSIASPIYQTIKFLGYGGTERARITGIDTASNNVNGQLGFWTGQAGSTVEQMRIDALGFVGIGTTTPGYKLEVRTDGASDFNWVTSFNNTAAGGYGAGFVARAGSNFGYFYMRGDGTAYVENAGANPLAFATNGNERMRISSTGDVGIGTSSPIQKLHVGGVGSKLAFDTTGVAAGNDIKTTNDYWLTMTCGRGVGSEINLTNDTGIRFNTDATERMRLDASGNLLVGKSTAADTTVGFSVVGNTSSSQYGAIASTLAGSTSGNQTMLVYSTGASAYRFYVDMAGTVYATSTSISAISDQRLKENVRDLDAGLDTILALKPRRFDWKEGKGKDVRDDMGFIAQEVEEVLPELIGDWKSGEGDPEDLKSVKAGDLIPVLVKAIQELTARVAQLEGN